MEWRWDTFCAVCLPNISSNTPSFLVQPAHCCTPGLLFVSHYNDSATTAVPPIHLTVPRLLLAPLPREIRIQPPLSQLLPLLHELQPSFRLKGLERITRLPPLLLPLLPLPHELRLRVRLNGLERSRRLPPLLLRLLPLLRTMSSMLLPVLRVLLLKRPLLKLLLLLLLLLLELLSLKVLLALHFERMCIPGSASLLPSIFELAACVNTPGFTHRHLHFLVLDPQQVLLHPPRETRPPLPGSRWM